MNACLQDVALLNPRLATSFQPESTVSFVPMAAVSAEKACITVAVDKPYSEVSKGYTSFQNGDVLVAKITPCFENGKIAQALIPRQFGFGSTEFHVIRPKPERLDGRYLHHFLRQPRIRAEGEERMTGSGGQRRVPTSFLSQLVIHTPPLPEQRRIAAILDQADALRAKRREALAQLDSLTQSIFMEMFGDTVINPKRFPMMSISEITDKGRGLQLQPDTSVWNLNLDQIESNTGRIHEKVICRLEQLGSSTFPFKAGTVLYSKLRPYLNKVVIADEDGYATTELVPIRCKQDIVKPIFLATFLRSKRFLDFANLTVAGAKMPRMVMDSFWSYTLPLPDLALQNEFERKFKAVEKLISIQRSSIVKLDTLFSSLQHRAFQGKL
ncbi:MAG: restriction endonuclease subunit S [Xanthomonadaceae bacterium]|nr:restriction endonuclease subunit S [Xanthomonadaceae bacterium]